MKFPWNSEEEKKQIEKLQNQVEELEEEKNTLQKKFDAEKERRSKLASEKQSAEEEKNRLKDKLRNTQETVNEKEKEENTEWKKLEFSEAKNGLRKINSIESPEEDLITVFSPEKISQVSDLKGLKNSLSSESYSKISGEKSFTAFMDNKFFHTVLRMRPFTEPEWSLAEKFEAGKILEFIREEKHWTLVSANQTQIFREKDGEWEEVKNVKSRVNKQQKKGGFSQGRFERKRDEQIEEHLKQSREALENLENVKLLGEKSLCEKLPGERLGGFDSSRAPSPDMFYNFQLKDFDT